MKIFFNFVSYTILLVYVFSFSACSNEAPLELQLEAQNTLTADSDIVNLMARTVSNDGSFDNIIDGSSCFDIEFPYVVKVHGIEITINSKDDLKIIEGLFDAVDDDHDILDVIFPVTIIMSDYAEIIVSSIDDLNEIAKKCIEGGADDDIECIDVVYPVTLFTYDPNLEQTDTVTVNNDKQMRLFFTSLGEDDIISLQFPVVFVLLNGTKVTANDNLELASAIDGAQNACDEDDDNDYNDDDFTKEQLDSLLVECTWLINEIKRNSQFSTAQYIEYRMHFLGDGLIIAEDREGNEFLGSWETSIIDYRVNLAIEFQFLEDFNSHWFVYEIAENKIKLHIDSDSDKIILNKSCEEPMVVCTESFITETLQNCVWNVSNGENDSFLDELSINFSDMYISVTDRDGTVVDQGDWEISETTITFHNLSMSMANYIGDFEIEECSSTRFKMKRGEEYLVVEKYCESTSSRKK